MKKKSNDMPAVTKCDVESCAYNQAKMCRAFAITVGDGEHPRCDTFTKDFDSGGLNDSIAKVGACKVSICEYNSNLECQAPGITVGRGDDEADCLTFEREHAKI